MAVTRLLFFEWLLYILLVFNSSVCVFFFCLDGSISKGVGLAPGGIAGTVGGPGGRVFGKNENKASSENVGSASMVDLSDSPTPEALRRRGNPSGRWGRVEDVALSALYMCTDAGGWITGTRLVVDGGTAHRAAGFLDAKRAIEKKSTQERASFSGGVAKAKL